MKRLHVFLALVNGSRKAHERSSSDLSALTPNFCQIFPPSQRHTNINAQRGDQQPPPTTPVLSTNTAPSYRTSVLRSLQTRGHNGELTIKTLAGTESPAPPGEQSRSNCLPRHHPPRRRQQRGLGRACSCLRHSFQGTIFRLAGKNLPLLPNPNTGTGD